MPPELSGDQYKCACAIGFAVPLVLRDASLTPSERERLAEEYAANAVAILRRAEKSGYFRNPANVGVLEGEMDFVALRGRPDFQLLLNDLMFPADPFQHESRTH